MDFSISPELWKLRQSATEFARKELLPLERNVIESEAERGLLDSPILDQKTIHRLDKEAQAAGLGGIDVSARFGGQGLSTLAKCLVTEQLRYSIVPYVLPPDAPNLFLLEQCCRGEQVQQYLVPYACGEKRTCIALTEENAGSDMAALETTAVRRGGKWILNGTKVFITNAKSADFIIVMARTREKPNLGTTLFLVDKGTPGLTVPRSFPTVGEYHPYEVKLSGVELDDSKVLGEVDAAFPLVQRRMSVRRVDMAAKCAGLARRCLDLMIDRSKERFTFGKALADRQAIQWWIADSFQELELTRLLMYRAAWRIEEGQADVRNDASMAKVQGTETVMRVVDRAIQTFGAYGVSKTVPLEYIYRVSRHFRIIEGTSEIHRWIVARDLIKNGVQETFQ